MVSDFRKKKLLHVFHTFFDTDRSGDVDRKDFELAIEKIAQLRGWKAGEYIYEEAKKIAVTMWEGLQSQADKNNDGHVTADEWIQLWDEFAKNPEKATEWQMLYCRFIFQLEDAGMDGKIDANEFAALYVSFGLNKDECIDAFKKMAAGKEHVNWDEFQVLWKEYFATEDKDAPGNFIFGKYDA